MFPLQRLSTGLLPFVAICSEAAANILVSVSRRYQINDQKITLGPRTTKEMTSTVGFQMKEKKRKQK